MMSKNLFDLCVESNSQFCTHSAFQNHSKESSLRTFLIPYQQKLDNSQNLSQEDIVNIAKKIHIDQIFIDGNHRTAIYIIYYLNIQQRTVLGAKPYYLFGACEYLDNQLTAGLPEDSNRLLDAIESRTFRRISSDKAEEEVDKMLSKLRELPNIMQHIRDNLSPSPKKNETEHSRHSIFSKSGTTVQVKNYKAVLSPVFNRSPPSIPRMSSRSIEYLSPLNTPRKSIGTVSESPALIPESYPQTPPLFFLQEPPAEAIRPTAVSSESSPISNIIKYK